MYPSNPLFILSFLSYAAEFSTTRQHCISAYSQWRIHTQAQDLLRCLCKGVCFREFFSRVRKAFVLLCRIIYWWDYYSPMTFSLLALHHFCPMAPGWQKHNTVSILRSMHFISNFSVIIFSICQIKCHYWYIFFQKFCIILKVTIFAFSEVS